MGARSRNTTERARTRGAALLLVVIFMVGAMMLAATLLATSEHRLKAEGERHCLKNLHAVLRAGAATALDEINRDRLDGPFDPDGDGVGALLGAPGAGGGVEQRAADGLLMGRYRTTVRREADGTPVLVVLAAYPSFTHTPRHVIGAELEISLEQLEVGDRPFEVIGRAGGDVREQSELSERFEVDRANILISDPTFSVPAVNITDPLFHQACSETFEREIAEGEMIVVGGNGNDKGKGRGSGNGAQNGNGNGNPPAASGADTITNSPASHRLNTEAMRALSRAIIEYVAQATPGALDLTSAAVANGAVLGEGDEEGGVSLVAGGSVSLPPGTYHVPGDLELEGGITLKGSGTLIVSRELSIERGATLDWNGDVIVAASDEESAELSVEHGGTLQVAGVLALEGSEATLELEGGEAAEGVTTVRIEGALLLLTDALGEEDDEGEVELEEGAELQVDGAFVIVSEHLHFELEDGAALTVNGAFSILVPDDARNGLHEFHVEDGGDMRVLFDRPKLDIAVAAMRRFAGEVFGGDHVPLPARLPVYVERDGVLLFEQQQAAIRAGVVGLEGR